MILNKESVKLYNQTDECIVINTVLLFVHIYISAIKEGDLR